MNLKKNNWLKLILVLIWNYEHLLHFLNLILLHSETNLIKFFTSPPEDFGSIKFSLIYSMYFLSIQLLNELSQPFHLKYGLFTFILITFSNLIFFYLFLTIIFHKNFQ